MSGNIDWLWDKRGRMHDETAMHYLIVKILRIISNILQIIISVLAVIGVPAWFFYQVIICGD